ncbi:hypothetical protein [Acidithiobacillus sp.]
MAISALELQTMTELGSGACSDGEDVLAVLRPRFPALTITRCPSSDVIETPFQRGDYFDVHLVDTSEHCWRLTRNMAVATAVLLAMHERRS